MSSAGGRQPQFPKGTQPGTGAFAGKQATMLLEKGNPGIRRATPDSEALASSDDETDHGMSSSMTSNPPTSKPTRRPSGTSWLSEIPSQRRKPSITFGVPSSPAESYPATSPADQGTWPSAVSPGGLGTGRTHPASSASFPWGSGIWNEKKEAPARLQEVMPSQSSAPKINPSLLSNDYSSPPGSRATMGDGSIPFTIPLHPTPKTYRSQSYSVGQLEQDLQGSEAPAAAGSRSYGRGRGGHQYANLQHRSSRPSILGDLGHDTGILGRVREDEDDEEEEGGPSTGVQLRHHPQPELRQTRIDQPLTENTGFYHADNSFRDRTMPSVSTTSPYVEQNPSYARSSNLYGTGLRESDDVVDDPEEYNNLYGAGGARGPYARRYSEHQNAEQISGYPPQDSRSLETIRKARWETSLGFGSIPELPQSRRHSFADVTPRQGSLNTPAGHQQSLLGINSRLPTDDQHEPAGYYAEDTQRSSRGDNRESKIPLNPLARKFVPPAPPDPAAEEVMLKIDYLRNRKFAATYFAGESSVRSDPRYPVQDYPPPIPHGRNQHTPHGTLARHDQLLFVVTFKAQRADVFFVADNTGLDVKEGDMVIVEADRGTDLGTVAAANVSWDDARTIKAQLSEEHYKWLMLFSRQGQAAATTPMNTSSIQGLNVAPGSAVGGMGPPGTHGLQEPQSGELKPKLIKRLAQNHEIQTLRDKEGNEAKAKRVCQQKVVEHRLNMEILDAEFQMDWKKLTFYYFADAYINFNSLVTDLFKIYKTRIWMSAINPDSFITPTPALTQPSPTGLGPGNIGSGRDNAANRRRQAGMPGQPSYMNDLNEQSRAALLGQSPGVRSMPSNAYPSMAMLQPNLRPQNYSQAMSPHADPFGSYMNNQYAAFDPMSAYNIPNSANDRSARSVRSPTEDWTAGFQGLSLGS